MACPLIWIPEQQSRPTAQEIKQLGLDWLGEHSAGCLPNVAGPAAGISGLLMQLEPNCPGGRTTRAHFEPETQEWVQALDPQPSALSPSYWYGWRRDDPPRPEDLARPDQYLGYPVQLGDGRQWLVPTVRAFGTKKIRLEPHVGWLSLMQEDEELLDVANRYWDSQIVIGKTEKPRVSEVIDFACKLLGVHYRIGPLQISTWGLLEKQALDQILWAALDLPAVQAELAARKKKDVGRAQASEQQGTQHDGSRSTATTAV